MLVRLMMPRFKYFAVFVRSFIADFVEVVFLSRFSLFFHYFILFFYTFFAHTIVALVLLVLQSVCVFDNVLVFERFIFLFFFFRKLGTFLSFKCAARTIPRTEVSLSRTHLNMHTYKSERARTLLSRAHKIVICFAKNKTR